MRLLTHENWKPDWRDGEANWKLFLYFNEKTFRLKLKWAEDSWLV